MKPMSERQSIANRIARFISVNRLNNPFGGDVVLDRSGKFPVYTTLFSKPRVLDGSVSVFSPTFIRVKFETAFRSLPNHGHFVFESEANAVKFLKLAFIDLAFDEAMEVPVRKGTS